MKIALVQMNIEWEKKEVNFSKAEKHIRRAAEDECDVVILPEMFNTGFSMNIPVIAENEQGETSIFLSRMAEKYNVAVIAGFVLKDGKGEKGHNTAEVYDNHGKKLTRYIKMHPFSFAEEDVFYIPGDSTELFKINNVSSSIFICYDLRFPEVFRCVAKDVSIIFVIANWPAARVAHWEALLKARAIENQCYVVGVNRTGTDGNGIAYPGASHVFDPLGNDLCAGNSEDELLTCIIDISEVNKVRSKFPFIKDMRLSISY